MLLLAHLVSLLHLYVLAHGNILPYHQQMQVQQTNKGCPNRSLDGHVTPSSLLSVNLCEVVKNWVLWRVPNHLHYDMPATYYHNGRLQFLGMSYALDLL